MAKIRYDLRTSFESGYENHPQKVMEELGYVVKSFEGIPIGDCAIMDVEKIIYPLEKFLTVIDNGS